MQHIALGLFVVVGLASGCLSPGAFQCGDGRTCPEGTTCDDVRSLCLTPAQTTACDNIINGKPCNADGTPGICDRGFCEPGCGDGVTDPDEQCDDGNFASHDGCSSRCLVEIPSWSRVESPWSGVTQHVAAYHETLDRVVLLGGLGLDGGRDQIWQRDPARLDRVDRGWRNVTDAFPPGERPPARSGSAIASDPVRQVLVVFGGAGSADYSDETWEYAATTDVVNGERIGTWTKVATTESPGKLVSPAMAFDPSLGKIVLFGGFPANGVPPNETWTYDGTWTKLNPTTQPASGFRAAMAYDPVRAKMVLFGGFVRFTYELSGGDWIELDQPGAPPRRTGLAMAYDPTREKIVVFGGLSSSAVAADTWTYDGSWEQVSSLQNPPGRRAGTLVADPVNGVLELVGGSDADDSEPFSDVWHLSTVYGWRATEPRMNPPALSEGAAAFSSVDQTVLAIGGSGGAGLTFEAWAYDGVQWTQKEDAPVDRIGHALAYDADTDRFVLAGGYCAGFVTTDCDPLLTGNPDAHAGLTYLLDRQSGVWTSAPGVWPLADRRSQFAMVYDEANRQMVAFGGEHLDGTTVTYPTDTWLFDGASWRRQATTQHPESTVRPAATWDPGRGAVILFDSKGATWEYRDGDWTPLIAADSTTPAPRDRSAMTYDPLRRRIVLAGGSETTSGALLADVWELDTEQLTWTEVYVPGASPLPRQSFVLQTHVSARAIVLQGGATGTTFPNSDTWVLQYRSVTTDEDCRDGKDTDLDAQRDHEDPDCDPFPP